MSSRGPQQEWPRCPRLSQGRHRPCLGSLGWNLLWFDYRAVVSQYLRTTAEFLLPLPDLPATASFSFGC